MSENHQGKKLVYRQPWWVAPPVEGQTADDLEWGYLEIFDDGSFRFDPTRPTDEEIKNRDSCFI